MLGDNRGTALHNHILALERLQEAKDEASADFNERKKLAKEDGFDTNVVAAILKRRKNGEGQTQAFDDLLQEYENAIADQKRMVFDRVSMHVDTVQGFAEVADTDALYPEALALVIGHQKASTSWLQRQLKIGYNSAVRLIDRMEVEQVVSQPDNVGRRTVLLDPPSPDQAVN